MRLFILAEIGNFTASELKEHENSLTSMSDYYNIIDSAEKRAREEGREEGRMEVVQKLIASGMPVESVAELLQIPVEQLKDRY